MDLRRPVISALLAVTLVATAGAACAAIGLSLERTGLGLKPNETSTWLGSLAARDELVAAWRAAEEGDVIYQGARETLRFGVRTTESYGGLYFPLSESWGATLEMGVMPASPLVPRRYSLAGQLQTGFSGGSSLSLGLKYRIYEPDIGLRYGTPGETAANGYALAPPRPLGLAPGASYQVQLNYQYSAATTFGFVLGRELETFTAGFDQSGWVRQLTFTGQHWLTPSWALSYDVLSNDPNSFRLQGLRFGMRYRF